MEISQSRDHYCDNTCDKGGISAVQKSLPSAKLMARFTHRDFFGWTKDRREEERFSGGPNNRPTYFFGFRFGRKSRRIASILSQI